MKHNPPWLVDVLGDFWRSFEGKVPINWYPKLADVTSRRGKIVADVHEYGCGTYGCVVPTADEGVVLKVTTDASEIEYANVLSQQVPVQVTTRYFLVVKLQAELEGKKIALLWRESADHVGKLSKVLGRRACSAVGVQHDAASDILRHIIDRNGKTFDRPELVQAWLMTLRQMATVPALAFVANGMAENFAATGVMLLDVHDENLGLVHRDGQELWVITDPGNVIKADRRGAGRTKRMSLTA